jgi:hypothetical protein
MVRRSKKGQSLVEYALGIGCVTACCMIALGFLGHVCGDIFQNVGAAINYGGSKPALDGAGSQSSVVNFASQPWSLN